MRRHVGLQADRFFYFISTMQLDHLVINTRFATDEAYRQFSLLGFQLTPRGHHSLGSINHLIMFPGHYLELIGLPVGATTLRQEVVDSVDGIDGLVLRTTNATATASRLEAHGVSMQPVQRFSRPVTIAGETSDARFETVRLVPGQFAAGRVYYCHHLTPELVWRDEWLTHPNGALSILSLTVSGDDPTTLKRQYELLDEPTDEDASLASPSPKSGTRQAFKLCFNAPADLRERFGKLADYLPPRADAFVALTFAFPDRASLERLRTAALQAGLPVGEIETLVGEENLRKFAPGKPVRLLIAIPAFFTLIECCATEPS